ncbi:MAG: FAD-dependent oxidoreductase [Cyclobacteriaceae bacterium]
MVERKVDFIVVGQGIAGSWLAHELIKREHQIVVINHETPDTSSFKAAGLYNPITGRKMVKTWLADELFADLEKKYQELERLLGEKFLHQLPIYRPFLNIEEKNDWDIKAHESAFENFTETVLSESMGYPGIKDDLGGIVIKKSGYVNLFSLISSFKSYLISKGIYKNEKFDFNEVTFHGEKVKYKDIEANKILFCEGPSQQNPYWQGLPFKFVRGEIIDMECGLESNHIINRGVFMIPKDDYFTVGSTYDHNNLSFEPQPEGILNLKQRLSKLFSGTYRIREKRAGIRPATFDRKPFIGLSQKKETLGIFNGFGTKGVSLTPYFATQFVDFLEGKEKIEREADVKRVF